MEPATHLDTVSRTESMNHSVSSSPYSNHSKLAAPKCSAASAGTMAAKRERAMEGELLKHEFNPESIKNKPQSLPLPGHQQQLRTQEACITVHDL